MDSYLANVSVNCHEPDFKWQYFIFYETNKYVQIFDIIPWYLIYAEPATKQGEWVSVKYCVPRLIMICAAAASLYLTTTTTTVRFLPLLALLSIRLYHVCLGSFCNTICHQYVQAREGGGTPFVSIRNIQWRQQEFMAIHVDRLWNKFQIFRMELA